MAKKVVDVNSLIKKKPTKVDVNSLIKKKRVEDPSQDSEVSSQPIQESSEQPTEPLSLHPEDEKPYEPTEEEVKSYESSTPLSPVELRKQKLEDADPIRDMSKQQGLSPIETELAVKDNKDRIVAEENLRKIKEEESNFKIDNYTKFYSDRISKNLGIDPTDTEAKSKAIKEREKREYRGFLTEESDLKELDAINEIESINNKIKETESLNIDDKAKQAQIDNYNNQLSEVEGLLSKSKEEREGKINYKISNLSIDLKEAKDSGDTESQEEIQKQIDILNSQKELIFKPIETIVSEISKGEEEKLEGPTAQDKFNNYYDALYEEYNELKSQDKIQSLLGQKGVLSKLGSDIKTATFGGGDEEVNRFFELQQKLETLTPVRLLNRHKAKVDDEGFGRSFLTAYGNMSTPINRTSDTQQSQVIANTVSSLGVDINKGIEEKAETDYGLSDPEFWGSTIGTSAALMSQMMGSGAALKGTKLFKYLDKGEDLAKVLSRRRYLESLTKSPLLAKTLANTGTKAISFGKKAASAGLMYEGTGIIFTNAEDEANYLSGLYGSVGEQTINSLLPQSRKLTPILKRMLGDKGTKDFIASVIKKGSSATGRGLGETSEEFMQEVASIHQEENADFFKELENRFGTFDEASKFIVSSFVMGAFMGGGDSVSSSLHKNTKEKLEQLKKENPEQAAKVEEAIKEINKESINALDESVDETKVEGEYKVNDKDVPYSDIEDAIDTAADISDLEGITVNNDAGLQTKLSEKYNELLKDEDTKKSPESKEDTTTEEQEVVEGDVSMEGEDKLSEPKDAAEPVVEETEETITDDDYNTFVDKGEVNEDILSSIASKIKTGETLTERETAIHADKTGDIEQKLKEEAPTTTKEDTTPSRVTPKTEIESKSGKQVGSINKDTGKFEVLNKNGTKPDAKTARKVRREYESSMDYNHGSKAELTEDMTPDQVDSEIASKSENVGELVELIDRRREAKKYSESDRTEEGSKDWHISENLGKVNLESFTRNKDISDINPDITKNWIHKPKKGDTRDNTKDIDRIAQEISDISGQTITEQDIVDFIIANPKGVSKNKKVQDEVLEQAEQRFLELTGLKVNDNIIQSYERQLIKEEGISDEEINKAIENEYAEDQYGAYLEDQYGEDSNKNRETKEAEEVPPREEQKEKVKESKVDIDSKQQESSKERVNRVIKNAIERSSLPKEVKEKLSKKITGNVLTVKQTKKVAKSFLDEFDGNSLEAFEAAQNSDLEEVFKTAIAIETIARLKNEHAKLEGNPEAQTRISEIQANIINIIEDLQQKSTDRGRAINILKDLYEDVTPEALEISVKKSTKKYNDTQKETYNIDSINEKDIEDITKAVLESDEIKKLKEEIQKLKEKNAKLEKNQDGLKKERAKIKQHKKNIKKIKEEFKNSPKDLFNATIIPGLTAKGVKYALDLSKEYIAIGVTSSKALAKKLHADFKELGKDLLVSDLEKLAEEAIQKDVDAKEKKELDKGLKKLKETARSLEASIDKLFEEIVLGKTDINTIEAAMKDIGMSESEAKSMAKKIEKRLSKKLKTSIEDKVKNKLSDAKKLKTKKARKARNIADKTILAMKSGASINEVLSTEFDKSFGILDLDNESFTNELRKHITKITNSPTGSRMREKAESKMLDFIKSQRNIHYGNALNSFIYANILSGYNTHINNIGYGAELVAKEFIKNTFLGVADRAYWESNKRMWNSMMEAWNIATDVFESGLEGDVKYETTTKTKNKYQKRNDLQRVPILGKLNSVLRALAAEDEFFTKLLQEGKLTKLLYEGAVQEEISKNGKISKTKRKDILKDLNKERYDEKKLQEINDSANIEVTKANGLSEPLMVKDNDGDMVLNEAHKGLKNSKELVRDYNIRKGELIHEMIDANGENVESAYEYAKQEILSGQPTGSAAIIYRALANSPIFGSPVMQLLAIPFVKVPINSAKRVMDYTPIAGSIWHTAKLIGNVSKGETSNSTLGLLLNDSYLDKLGVEKELTKDRKAQIINRQITAFLSSAALLSAIYTTSDDDDEINPIFDITGDLGVSGLSGYSAYKREMTLKNAEAKLPNTIYIGGEPLASYLYTPYVGIFSFIGGVRDIDRGDSKDTPDSMMMKAMLSSARSTDVVLEQSALASMREIFDMVSKSFEKAKKGEYESSSEEFAKFFMKKAKMLIPASGALNQLNDDVKAVMDKPASEITKLYEYAYRGIPFADETLETREDFFGYDIKRNVNLGPLRSAEESNKHLKIFEEFDYDLSNAEYNTKTLKNPYTNETVELSKEDLYQMRKFMKKRRKELLIDSNYLKDMKKTLNKSKESQAVKDKIFKKSTRKLLSRARELGKMDYFEKHK